MSCLVGTTHLSVTGKGFWAYFVILKWAGCCHLQVPSVFADMEGALTRSPNINPHLTQYDLNLKGFTNPISTLNTEMPDKGQLGKYTLYVPGILGTCLVG